MGMLKEEYLPHYNYADYCQWEGNLELIYGQAYAMNPSPTFEHQEISLTIARELRSILKNCKQYNKSYQIEGNFTSGTYSFVLDNCEIELNFSDIFGNEE